MFRHGQLGNRGRRVPGSRLRDQALIDERCLVLGKISGRPSDTVLRVQFGGQGSSGERAMEALLVAPRGVFAVSIEAKIELTMA